MFFLNLTRTVIMTRDLNLDSGSNLTREMSTLSSWRSFLREQIGGVRESLGMVTGLIDLFLTFQNSFIAPGLQLCS